MTTDGSRRPNPAKVTYDRDTLLSVLHDHFGAHTPESLRNVAADYETRRATGADAPCQAVVRHGPGHQSSTYCQVRGGPDHHDRGRDEKIVHFAHLVSGGYAEWTDDRPYAEEDPW